MDASVAVTQHGTAAWNVIVSLSWLRIVKKMLRLLPNIEGFGEIPGPEAYQNKNDTPNVDDCVVWIHFHKGEVFSTWAPPPNPKNDKASLSKVQALKFILPSLISALHLQNCSTSSFQKLVEKVQNYINEFWLILKKMSWARWFWAFFFFLKKILLPHKMG